VGIWFLGYPEAALADSDQAIRDAREIGQAATLMMPCCTHRLPISTVDISRQQLRPQRSHRFAEKKALYFGRRTERRSKDAFLA